MVEGDNVSGGCLDDPPSVSGLLKRSFPEFQDLGSVHEPEFARVFVFYGDDGVSLFPCVLKVIKKQVWITGGVCILLAPLRYVTLASFFLFLRGFLWEA